MILILCFAFLLAATTTTKTTTTALRQPQPPALSDELGCSPTLSILINRERYIQNSRQPFVYFDPLNLATDTNFANFRECELKHSRVSMAAMAQIILVPVLKRFHPPSFGGFFGSGATSTPSSSVLPKDFPESIVASFRYLQPLDYIKVIVTCGILESFVFVQKDPLAMPGDYGTGYFGVIDKGLNEDKLRVELEHGRLAMLAFVSYLIIDYATKGKSWIDTWLDILEILR